MQPHRDLSRRPCQHPRAIVECPRADNLPTQTQCTPKARLFAANSSSSPNLWRPRIHEGVLWRREKRPEADFAIEVEWASSRAVSLGLTDRSTPNCSNELGNRTHEASRTRIAAARLSTRTAERPAMNEGAPTWWTTCCHRHCDRQSVLTWPFALRFSLTFHARLLAAVPACSPVPWPPSIASAARLNDEAQPQSHRQWRWRTGGRPATRARIHPLG